MAILLDYAPNPKPKGDPTLRDWIRDLRRSPWFWLAIIVGLCIPFAPVLTQQTECTYETYGQAMLGPNGPINQAIDLFRFNTGRWPARLDDLIIRPNGTAAKGWNGPYLPEASALLDPWGRPFQCAPPKDLADRTTRPVVWSLGPDGMDKTADDIR